MNGVINAHTKDNSHQHGRVRDFKANQKVGRQRTQKGYTLFYPNTLLKEDDRRNS